MNNRVEYTAIYFTWEFAENIERASKITSVIVLGKFVMKLQIVKFVNWQSCYNTEFAFYTF